MNPSHDLQGLKKKAKETFLYALSALLLALQLVPLTRYLVVFYFLLQIFVRRM